MEWLQNWIDWNLRNIFTTTKVKLRSLVICIALDACETWTFSRKIEQGLQASEMQCYRQILGVVWKQRITNEATIRNVEDAIGVCEPFTEVAWRRNVSGLTMSPDNQQPWHIQSCMDKSAVRGWGQPKHAWLTDISRWSGKSIIDTIWEADNGENWRRLPISPSAVRPWDLTTSHWHGGRGY